MLWSQTHRQLQYSYLNDADLVKPYKGNKTHEEIESYTHVLDKKNIFELLGGALVAQSLGSAMD